VTQLVSIIVPTFRRPQRLLVAAMSALAQRCETPFELVIVDNDPQGSALAAARGLIAGRATRIAVVHEPRPGVAHARNAGLAEAQGDLIAFLDDDETAPPTWLADLLRVQSAHDADIVFGPVRTDLSEAPIEHADFFDAFFARDPGHAEGPIDALYGCGCSLIRRAALPSAQPFSPERNEIGGEDDLLFQHMQGRGARIAWAPNAFVWETPEPSRVTLAYTLRRAFAYGQGPATHAWFAQPKNLPAVAKWMAVGLVQSALWGFVSAFAWSFRTPRRAFVYRRFVEGVGKTFWFPLIKPRFYGAARLKALDAAKLTPAGA
jgi:glycosyltransferase involved in cell wall biosynthesis